MIEATSIRLTAMSIQKIQMEKDETEEEISQMRNQVAELIPWRKYNKLLKDRLKTKKLMKSLQSGIQLRPGNPVKSVFFLI